MKIAVFLGPSLPVERARTLLDAHYMPPAAMGDVYAAVVREHPDVIGIIDGYFDSVPAVWHKEILFALSHGVRVVGASSMGALRAAELAAFGMEGVGWVFEAFQRGELEDDDEVAIMHSDADLGYRNLSVAMVNLRVGLVRACDRGLLSTATKDVLVALAKRRFYPERSWERLLRDGAEYGLPADELGGLRAFLEAERPDVKQDDACELLRRLAVAPAERTPTSGIELAPTIFWDKLARNEQRVGSGPDGVARAESVRRFVKATAPDLAALQRESLLIHFVERECELLGLELTQEQFDAAIRNFRRHRNLTSAESLRAWLEQTGLSNTQFSAMMQLDAKLTTLLDLHAGEVDEHLLDALTFAGRLAETLARQAKAEERAQVLAAAGQPEPSAKEIEEFYRSSVRPFTGSLQAHARALGFASASELIDEVRKIYEPTEA